eukprot:gene21313-33466_t
MYRHFEIPAGTTTIYPQSWLAWQIDRATITSVAIPGNAAAVAEGTRTAAAAVPGTATATDPPPLLPQPPSA